MSENKCCATCDRATQLYVGDTPTVYRFCQLSGDRPHLSYEYCEDYIPKNKENNVEGQLCETCRYYNNNTYWCSQYNDTTYNPNCSLYQVKEEKMCNLTDKEAEIYDQWLNAEATDVQPIRRGEWEMFWQNGKPKLKCTNCHTLFDIRTNDKHICIYPKFCEECGADMREHEPIKG